ncbi:hypothetical protein Hanom_Chr04g00297641 [Helianthus anomalus]
MCKDILVIVGIKRHIFYKSKLPFWSLRFGHFCHFSPKLKPFTTGSLWFQFYCHFGPKVKSGHICVIKSCYLVFFLRGKIVILIFLN